MQQYARQSRMKIVRLREVSIDKLVSFFATQPEEAYRYFKPHGFDDKSWKTSVYGNWYSCFWICFILFLFYHFFHFAENTKNKKK